MVRVLVVDDERDFTDLLSERLRTRGMEVRTAYNGQEALDVARIFAPEVVVLDITMPGMSGIETMYALRAEKPAPEVILLTADTTLGTAVAGMKGGARDYLTKPTDIDTLVSAIGEAEGRRMENMSRQRMAETAKLAALGELATGVAHEINNPLQVILNEAGWIEEILGETALEGNSREQILESIALIRRQGLRCKAITSKLLTLRCALDAKGATTNLPDLVHEVLIARRAQIEKMGIRVEKHWPEQLREVKLPDSEWSQILGNLVDNAMDALESTPAEERLLTIQADVDDAELIISVQDSGCGIEEHLLTRIFEPFFSTKEVGKGIGLGLAICHGIIEAMGGSISVRSTPGHGSTFTIKVPMAVHAHNEHNGPENPASAKEE
ncbi:hybrid sensor histidine kinase/response regulator [Desulfomicrobium baculatum]|uniref:histidine kinase n=1 Tax=Desulfomicrobium baculatum (strain DSM 4028 / VKM B-1378 / X) TaxID=525897 RepID=C7LQF2_DESBD|nr:hybrid sensor histidine kinase/response regulator [Desulfomicrobium baculatum]ACU90354.1 response regulator receiver sensor signal transduction histidine kinase [Desulfomicrobium baculatum DSM 4028]